MATEVTELAGCHCTLLGYLILRQIIIKLNSKALEVYLEKIIIQSEYFKSSDHLHNQAKYFTEYFVANAISHDGLDSVNFSIEQEDNKVELGYF